MKIAEFIKIHQKKIHEIATSHGAINIRLFGSFARNEGTKDSDIDLLVSMQPEASLLDIIAIKQDLEELLKRKVDVVTENSLSPYIREDVFKEAVNL